MILRKEVTHQWWMFWPSIQLTKCWTTNFMKTQMLLTYLKPTRSSNFFSSKCAGGTGFKFFKTGLKWHRFESWKTGSPANGTAIKLQVIPTGFVLKFLVCLNFPVSSPGELFHFFLELKFISQTSCLRFTTLSSCFWNFRCLCFKELSNFLVEILKV